MPGIDLSRLRTPARAVFVAVAIAAAGWLLLREGPQILLTLASADLALVGAALIAGLGHLALAALSWRCVVPLPQTILPIGAAARLFFLSQLGKYVPGGVWNFVAAAELARTAGLSRSAVVGSFLLALLIGVSTCAMLAMLMVPQAAERLAIPVWLVPVGIGGMIAGLVILDHVWPSLRGRLPAVSPRAMAGSALLALGCWLCSGAMVTLLIAAVGAKVSGATFLLATGAYAFAWIAGFVALVAPAGLAVREAALIAVLSLQLGLAEASAVALMARVLVTLADLGAGLAAALHQRGQALHPAPAGRDPG